MPSTQFTPESIAEQRKIIEAATRELPEAPWERGGPYPSVSVIAEIDPGSGWPDPTPPQCACVLMIHNCGDDFKTPPPQEALALANFIAASRTGYPDALDEVERLQGVLREIREATDERERHARQSSEEEYAERLSWVQAILTKENA
jgi:hypothetical protein